MKIIDCKQGSDAWLALRAGIPTASELDNLVTPLWKIRTGDGPESYLYRKLAERCMGFPLQQASAWAMDQGKILEEGAIPWFMWEHDVQVNRVGFVTTDDGSVGCSPDGLIGEDGGVELKCPQPDTHLKYLVHGGVPKEYLAQVYGSMFVTGRAWWYFCSFNRGFPALTVKVERDEKIMAVIGEALKEFNERLDAAYAKLKAMAVGEDERPLPPGRRFKALVFAA